MSTRPQLSSSSSDAHNNRKRPRNVTQGKSNAASSSSQARLILPNDLLLKLKGRRVVVRLTTQRVEIEAILVEVEVDSGSLSLRDAMVFQVLSSSEAAGRSQQDDANGSATVVAPTTTVQRELVEKANKLMVNGKYVAMVSVKANEES